jgi:hypothetical protein
LFFSLCQFLRKELSSNISGDSIDFMTTVRAEFALTLCFLMLYSPFHEVAWVDFASGGFEFLPAVAAAANVIECDRACVEEDEGEGNGCQGQGKLIAVIP